MRTVAASRTPRFTIRALGVVLIALSAVAPLPAQSGGNFVIKSNTLDAGGARSSGGTFVVTGTIGQHDAEPLQPSVGGTFAVTGGFWTKSASAPAGDDIFTDGFEGPP